ncbi:hypothetical protein pb186bvf_012852 [Paramecium bursaria]
MSKDSVFEEQKKKQIHPPLKNPYVESVIRGQKFQPLNEKSQQQDIQQSKDKLLENSKNYPQPQLEQKINLSQRKIFEEIREINYQEFNRYCLIASHQKASIKEICTHKKCKQPSRFLCEFCIFYGIHKSDNQQGPALKSSRPEVYEKIKQNYNNLVKIYKRNTNLVDTIQMQLKIQVEKLYQNIASFVKSTQFEESQNQLSQLQLILTGQQIIGQFAYDGNDLFKLISEQPENYLCEEFGDIIRGFNSIKKDIDDLNQISQELPNVIKELIKIKKIEESLYQSSDQIMNEAKASIESGQVEQAIELLIDHLQENRSKQQESQIRNILGYGYYKLKNYEKAICQFEKALYSSKIEANNYLYYYYIGKSQFKSYLTFKDEIQKEMRSEICAYFQQNFYESTQLNPKFNGAYIQISNIFENLGESNNQLQYLQLGLQNNSNDYKLTLLLGKAKFKMNLYQEALLYIDQALKLKKFDLKVIEPECMFKKFNPILTKGIILCKLALYNESLQILNEVIRYNKYINEAHYYSCICHYKLKQFGQALKIIDEQQENNYSKFDEIKIELILKAQVSI